MNIDQIKTRLNELDHRLRATDATQIDPLVDELLAIAHAVTQQNQQLHNQLRGARFTFAQITRRRQDGGL